MFGAAGLDAVGAHSAVSVGRRDDEDVAGRRVDGEVPVRFRRHRRVDDLAGGGEREKVLEGRVEVAVDAAHLRAHRQLLADRYTLLWSSGLRCLCERADVVSGDGGMEGGNARLVCEITRLGCENSKFELDGGVEEINARGEYCY